MSQAKKTKGLNQSDVGFERDKMNQKAESLFDEQFKFQRRYEESYENYKAQKNNKVIEQSSTILNYYKNEITNALKENNVLISNSQNMTYNDWKYHLKFQMKESLSINDMPKKEMVTGVSWKEIFRNTDRGIEL